MFQVEEFVLLEVELLLITLIVLSHLSNSNFVALRAALLPKLYNLRLSSPAVLAALVIHAEPHRFVQGIVVVVAYVGKILP